MTDGPSIYQTFKPASSSIYKTFKPNFQNFRWLFNLPNFQACFLFYLLTILSSLLPRLSKTFKLSNFQMDFLFTKLSILLPLLFTKLSNFQTFRWLFYLSDFQNSFQPNMNISPIRLTIKSLIKTKLLHGFELLQCAASRLWYCICISCILLKETFLSQFSFNHK